MNAICKILTLTLIMMTPSLSVFAADEIVCQASVGSQLKGLLKAADETHRSFVDRHESRMQTSLNEVLVHIECVSRLSKSMKHHERRHLLTPLMAIRESVRKAKMTKGELRDQNAQEAFRQMAHMSRIFNLVGHTYRIFFCDSDKSFWVQSGTQPLNPVHPDSLRRCGVRIPVTEQAVFQAD